MGGDRFQDFQTLLAKYNGVPDKTGAIPYSFASIDVVSAGDRDPDADDISGMSASKLRAYVAADDYENFKSGVPSNDSKLVKELWGALRRGLKLAERRYREDAAAEKLRREQDTQLDELSKKLKLTDQKAIVALKQEFFKALKTNPKLTVDEFAKSKEEKVLTPEEEKEVVATFNKGRAEEARKIIESIKNSPLAKDGGLSKLAIDPAKSTAKVFLTYSEPPTLEHLQLITAFARRRAFTDTNQQTLRSAGGEFTPPMTIIAIIPNPRPITKQASMVLAAWMKVLVLARASNIILIYGNAAEIASILSKHFAAIELSGQHTVLATNAASLSKLWSGMKQGGFYTTSITGKTCDEPNRAVASLIAFDKANPDISKIKPKLEAHSEEAKKVATTFKNKEKQEKQAQYWQSLKAIESLREEIFVATLPKAEPEYLHSVYVAFSVIAEASGMARKLAAAENLLHWFFGTQTGKLIADVGEHLGITGALKAVASAGKAAGVLDDTGKVSKLSPYRKTSAESTANEQ